jgi:uncharacterized membrane protein YagU involved in acid resistance
LLGVGPSAKRGLVTDTLLIRPELQPNSLYNFSKNYRILNLTGKMNNLISKIIKAGLIVGTLDILSAFIYYFIKTGEKNVFNVLKFVASGIFGKEAFSGGNRMIVAGLALHYIIAVAFTIFFFWLFPKIKSFSKNAILTGVIYGLFIWMVMNLVVVPLSNIGNRPFTIVNTLINVIILIVCIGIPLSFMANTFYKEEKPNSVPFQRQQ